MSQSNARASSAHSSASTLRPRTNRLISGLDERDESTTFDPPNVSSSRLASPIPSPFHSRSASPIPAAHPQRASPNARRHNGILATGSPNGSNSARQKKRSESPSIAGLFGSSWNAVQAIATDLLGNDLAGPDHKEKPRPRRPLSRMQSGPRSSTSAPPARWGPDAPTSHPQSGGIGVGTTEEQAAEFRARKRRDMLTGQSESYPDAMGKFKRRLSDDRNSASAPPGENEDREALIYLHPVQKNDTLAGITIRYNISANALRRANRMWPNDTILARKTLILPVDACAVKGKPVPGPEGEADLLGSESEALSAMQAEEVPTPTAATPLPNGAPFSGDGRTRASSASTTTTSSVAASSGMEHEQPWQHDSWVLLPGNSKPTEIARLPRRALGYFPPARRKSNALSDLETPSSSLDLSRANTNVSSHGHPAASPSGSSPPQRRRHTRRTSNAANGYFPNYLNGPGGVGSMSRNVHFPGPAQDGLNKMFAKHLPDVAPPRNQNVLYQPEMPLYSDDPTPATSGSATPAFPHSQGPNLNFNLEALGGAFENWARRMASKAAVTPQARREPARASVGTPGKGVGGIGDLIEMTDEFEIGGDEEDEEDRGRQSSNSKIAVAPPSSSATSYFEGAKMRGRGASHTKSNAKSSKAD